MKAWAWRGTFLVWLAGVAAGAAYTWKYSLRDGGASPVERWPEQAALARDASIPTLLMFVMANCPCSAASLHELNALLQDTRVQAHAYVVVEPPAPGDPGHGDDLLDAAHGLPRAQFVQDTGGAVRSSFQARTSGETHLYDPTGRLLFKGGITAARGHEGLSHSRELLASLLTGAPSPASLIESPVFGCHFAQDRASGGVEATAEALEENRP